MAISLKKMTLLAACAALLGSANLTQAADRHDQRRPVATHNQHGPAAHHRPHASAQHNPPGHAYGLRGQAARTHRAARPAYHRGGHVPSTWRGAPSRVVTNWRAYPYRNLHQPPRGYQWVRGDNGDVLLVAIATGVIASIVANAVIR